MSDDQNKPKEFKLEIRADEAVANGQYANFVMANNTETEFTLDFVFVPPQTSKVKIASRIILNPIHAKRLALMLNNQVEMYEKRFGTIPIRRPAAPDTPDNLN
jgi:hypothetical protein